MKRLPIGISDYKKVVEEDFSYVDKTLFIEEIVNLGAEVVLIPRPRRFGKTMNLSMLSYFFEKTDKDHSYLFQNFHIWKTETRKLQGKFPVIFLTLKGIKKGSWEAAYKGMQTLIAKEFERHDYLLKSEKISQKEKNQFQSIINEVQNQQGLFEISLQLLMSLLKKHHNEPVIVLIDEYDTPIHDAYLCGYYDPMIAFMRNWFTEGLKDSTFLKKAVLTGILRVSKESIFSGLNNPGCYTVLDEEFSDKFGLLEEEVSNLLQEHNISHQIQEIRKWYNGYHIGQSFLYNPWSILQCIQKKGQLRSYWVNTSDNSLIKKLLIKGNTLFKQDVELLLQGKTITKPISEEVSFKNLEQQVDAVWGLFLFSGYLTLEAAPTYKSGSLQCELKIPNQEISDLYRFIVTEWMTASAPNNNLPLLLNSLVNGEIQLFSELLQTLILNTMSYYDIPQNEPEKVYHAFVLGLLVNLENYEVKSNRESGFGRYDVCLIPKDPSALGIIMEFKKAKEEEDLKSAADDALNQIKKEKYVQELISRNIKQILTLGLAFKGKQVFIKENSVSF
ncbi:MAG: ATP-binding protein [Rhabdochlamydiaceae bacterium]|nr:ATP-binding protein [Rhabdochlamydiaceae bacterium]